VRLRVLNIIAACLLIVSVGGHWALLQSAAWMGMIVSYSQESGLRAAVEKTFDGKHPCQLCKAIRDGEKEQSKQTLVKTDLKINWMLAQKTELVWFPISKSEIRPRDLAANLLFDCPAIPPPRRA
jgi:hypothetical protein